eukprot:6202845-Pleurochrysis_carterae.AAC.1
MESHLKAVGAYTRYAAFEESTGRVQRFRSFLRMQQRHSSADSFVLLNSDTKVRQVQELKERYGAGGVFARTRDG